MKPTRQVRTGFRTWSYFNRYIVRCLEIGPKSIRTDWIHDLTATLLTSLQFDINILWRVEAVAERLTTALYVAGPITKKKNVWPTGSNCSVCV